MLRQCHTVSLFRAVLLAALLSACSQGNVGDEDTSSAGVPTGIERFLLFPNPLVQSGGGFETNTTAYADAYYRAVDPNGQRDTLAKWKAVNGFGTGGNEHLVVFRDVRDLGYGRRMSGRRNADGTVAFFVENYSITGVPGGYTSANVDAAVVRDTQWHIGTNAIEWTETPCDPLTDPVDCVGTERILKFFNFSSTTGQRQLAVDLDGKGLKAMPGPCITCHGGRGDPLTPVEAATSKPRYALVENSVSRKRGDTQARYQGFNVDSFEFAPIVGYTRADQEARLKDFNQWVLCTYPGGGSVVGGWGSCTRPAAGANEWQGTAAEMIEAWYGGPGMPNAQFSDAYVPAGWSGNAALYNDVVVPYCRTCHSLRGTANENDLDFSSEAKFRSYADRIKVHVFDRGNMPLAWIVYRDFWQSSAVSTLAAYIESVLGAGTVTTASGALREPGRPVADPGPDRMVATGTNAPLTAADSLFASNYNWTQVAGPVAATITNATSRDAIFFSNVVGNYTIRLTVGNGVSSDSTDFDATVDNSFPDPATIKFAHVKNVMRSLSTCTTCHTTGSTPLPPIFYTDIDRDGSGGATDAVDEAWIHKAVLGRVNLTEAKASPLLRKPSGNHHNSGTTPLDLSTTAGLSYFSMFYYWILNGAPAGGVVANAGTDSAPTVSFTPTASIALDGSASIDALTYAWTIVSEPNVGSFPASFSNASIVNPNLIVQFPGTYVVQLQVTNGSDSSTDTVMLNVSETAVTADFTPADGGTATIAFDAITLTGTQTLTNTGTGNPATCNWVILSGPGSLSGTSCSGATLTEGVAAVGFVVQVRLTRTGVNPANVAVATHNISIASAGSGLTVNAGANSTVSRTFANPLTTNAFGSTAPDSAGIAEATVSLNGLASGAGTITQTWTIISAPAGATGSYAPSIDNATALNTALRVRRKGSYTVRLTATNGIPPSVSDDRVITVNVAAGNAFSNVAAIFVARGCTNGGCHSAGSTIPPSWVNEIVSSQTLYQRVTARVSTANPTMSLIVTCPAEGCAMSQQTGFHSPDVSSYTTILNWIVDGAPP